LTPAGITEQARSYSEGLAGVVGDQDVRPGAAERVPVLEHDRALVDPAASGCRLDHRELAGDVVHRQRVRERLAQLADHVEVRQGGLDHQDVRALVDIQSGLGDRLAPVAGVHLVGAPVARARRRVGGLPERPVVRRGVLDRVRHDRGGLEPGVIQRHADGLDAAVHHVGWRHHVCARGRVGQRHLGEQRQGRIVVDAVVAHHAAVTVVGVRAQANVGHHRDRIAEPLADRGHGARHLVASGPRGPAVRALGAVGRDAEQQHRADPEVEIGGHSLDDPVHRLVRDAGHGVDRLRHAASGNDEVGLDQHPRVHARFSDQVADGLRGPQATGTDD
jgi:hypothetical protein